MLTSKGTLVVVRPVGHNHIFSLSLVFMAQGGAKLSLPSFLLILLFCMSPALLGTGHLETMHVSSSSTGAHSDRGDTLKHEQLPLSTLPTPDS